MTKAKTARKPTKPAKSTKSTKSTKPAKPAKSATSTKSTKSTKPAAVAPKVVKVEPKPAPVKPESVNAEPAKVESPKAAPIAPMVLKPGDAVVLTPEGKLEAATPPAEHSSSLLVEGSRRSTPKQKPGRSFQGYCTPANFMAALEHHFGKVDFDLAASADNAVCDDYFDEVKDAFKQSWEDIKARGSSKPLLWLNPPFAHIGPWAKRCSEYLVRGKGRILMIVPASVGSNWFGNWVYNKARVHFLTPRISFDGKDPYPKDCMLCEFGAGVLPGFGIWNWLREISAKDEEEKATQQK